MKLKINIRRVGLLFFGSVLLLTQLINILGLVGSGQVSAATPPSGAPTIVGNSTTLCSPQLIGAGPGGASQFAQSYFTTVDSNNAGAINDINILAKNSDPGISSTFTALQDNNQNLFIMNFVGADQQGNANAACGNSLVFFRTVNLPPNPNIFYGIWRTGSTTAGQTVEPVTATINRSTTPISVSFKLPNGVDATGAKAPALDDSAHNFLQNPVWFPVSGGGTVTSGQSFDNCIGAATNDGGLQACIDKRNLTADFTDTATIRFNGQTYIAGTWSGPDIRYSLDPGSTDQTLLGFAPYFDVSTGGATDLHISSTSSVDSLTAFGNALTRSNGLPGKVSITYKVRGFKAGINTDTTGLKTIARYYPSKDIVQLVFANGAGGNESHYIGDYSRSSTGTSYILQGGGFPDPTTACGPSESLKPQFTFTTDPKTLNSTYDGVTSANWVLPADSHPCAKVTVSNVSVVIMSASANPVVTNPDKSTGDTAPKINCSVKVYNPVSWLLCPLAVSLESVAGGLQNEIVSYLEVKTDHYNEYKQSWTILRNMSLGILAIATLIAIVAQAFGLEMLDAYTLRKALPRVLIVAIGMSLAWPLIMWLIGVSNDLGVGVRQLIYAPFHSQNVQFHVALGGGSGLLLGVLGGAALGILGFMGILSFAATAALAAGLALFVLVLRQMIIVALLVFSPIAIVCYALPNTQKVYQFWWGTLFGALATFPVYTGVVAIMSVFAAINSQNAGFVPQAVTFLIIIGEDFILILIVSKVGGGLASIAGAANDRSRGVFDRLKKGRQERMASRFKRAQDQTLFDNNSAIGKRANKVASWATDPMSNAAYHGRNIPGLRKRGNMVASQLEHARVEQSGKLFEELNKMGYNDKAYRLLSGQHGKFSEPVRNKLRDAGLLNKTPTSLGDLQKAADILATSDKATEQLAGNAIHGSMGRLATLYQDPEMARASVGAAGILGLAAHGFAGSDDIAGAGNTLLGGDPSNTSFAQAIASQAQVMGGRHRPDAKAGYGIVFDHESGKFVDGMSKEGGRMSAVLDTYTADDLAGAKGDAITTVEPEIIDRLQGRRGAERAVNQKDQLFSWAGPYSRASTDVKVKALGIIDKMSGGKKQQTRTRQVRGEDGKVQNESYTYTGYDEGTLGAEFERYARTELDPTLRGDNGPDRGGDDPAAGGGPSGH